MAVTRSEGHGYHDKHDPGAELARERAAAARAPVPARLRAPGTISIGTASWTDPTITAAGVFYPEHASSAEARLRHYASLFPLVEVDSTYYAIPARRMAELWVERTPDDFTFNIKAHALMTGHPTEVRRLPAALRAELPAQLADAERVYAKDLPPELLDEVWRTFADAVEPLRAAGKLGALLLQYPRWFVPSRTSAAELERARTRLPEHLLAVEFRQDGWLAPRLRERTLKLLEQHGLIYVSVDEPQGMRSSVPPLVGITSRELAIFRLHGRRADTWERAVHPVSERYRYLYDRDELAWWVPHVRDAAARADHVHVVFNNCYANYGTCNALEMAAMLMQDDG
jgi:uncharacterized protein YecE (DUF72 family)